MLACPCILALIHLQTATPPSVQQGRCRRPDYTFNIAAPASENLEMLISGRRRGSQCLQLLISNLTDSLPVPRRQQSTNDSTDSEAPYKRRRTDSNISHWEAQSKPGRRVHCTTERCKQALMAKDGYIRSLEEENIALRKQITDLEKQLGKKCRCPLCNRSFSRSDGLYKHLQTGDDEHKRLAKERYSNICKTCNKKCKRWGDLKKHMAKHKGELSGPANDLILESDERRCLIAATF